jgi:hypothetical protein
MTIPPWLCIVLLPLLTIAGEPTPSISPSVSLAWPADLPPRTKAMLEFGLKSFTAHPQVPYKTGSATLTEGMDCSGAMVFLLAQLDVTPPRSSSAMHDWLSKRKDFTVVPADARNADHPIYQKLQPGDLIFWAPDLPAVSPAPKASHVHMFLGRESRDKHPVMIGSSDGRSYRGQKRSGFGIVDFKVPAPGSKTRIIGFGPASEVAGSK